MPAYVVLSDASLEDLCRKRPSQLQELTGVTGIGERKAELYGTEILAVFEAYRKGARAEVARDFTRFARGGDAAPARARARLSKRSRRFAAGRRVRW